MSHVEEAFCKVQSSYSPISFFCIQAFKMYCNIACLTRVATVIVSSYARYGSHGLLKNYGYVTSENTTGKDATLEHRLQNAR